MSEILQGKWTSEQLKYIQFLARGCRTIAGEKRTEEQFGLAIGVNFSTLWRWKQVPGFKMAVVEAAVQPYLKDIPTLVDGQVRVAKGQSEFTATTTDGRRIKLKPNTNAFNAVMKLMGASERVESTVTADIKADVTHHLAGKSDDELDAIIKSATGA